MTLHEIKARFSGQYSTGLPSMQRGEETGTDRGVITYKTIGELVGELASQSYSVTMEKTPLLESIDGIRLHRVLERTDQELADAYAPKQYHEPLAQAIASGTRYKSNRPRTDKKVNQLIAQMYKSIHANPTTAEVVKQTLALAKYLETKQEEREVKYNAQAMESRDNDIQEMQKQGPQPRADINKRRESLPYTTEVSRLPPKVRLQVFNELRKLVKMRENQRRENTAKGKLQSKRLGHYPSPYLFTKKQRPAQRVDVYVMIDLSGSMFRAGKLDAVVRIKNELQAWNKAQKSVRFKMYGFNHELYEEHEIGNNYDMAMTLASRPHGNASNPSGSNADGYYLKYIMGIMKAQPHKTALLILSDGAPTPHASRSEPSLKDQARELDKSGIPYMSVGIYTNAPEVYYKNATVLNDLEELPRVIAKSVKHFLHKL